MPLERIIGTNVWCLRELRYPSITQQELATKAGLSVNTIIKVESNRHPDRPTVAVRTDTIQALADALDVPALALVSTKPYVEGVKRLGGK
jgi:transcriptional regulator with XRE-family HTH domain